MTDETVSDRGFTHWEPIAPVAGRSDGTDTVRFYESSAVASLDGFAGVQIDIEGPFAWLRIGETSAHLTRSEVERLHEYMARWLERHPGREEP